MQSVTQSLAGRAGVFHLLPLAVSELNEDLAPEWESAAFSGFYPRVRAEGLPADLFARDYLSTYVERDVRLVRNIQDLDDFRRFLKLCAGRCGQLLNLASLAQDAGLSVNTVKDWLALREASFLIFLIRPWNERFNKRLVKAPKLYWHDTSLLCSLLDIRKPEDLGFHPLRGAVFENLFVAERFKVQANRGLVTLWEAKAGKTVTPEFFSNLEIVGQLASIPASRRVLVYGGQGTQARSNGQVLGWQAACAAP